MLAAKLRVLQEKLAENEGNLAERDTALQEAEAQLAEAMELGRQEERRRLLFLLSLHEVSPVSLPAL